jgi:hypothetical protein
MTDYSQATPLTAAELAAIAVRAAGATPGPWGWGDIGSGSSGWGGQDMHEVCSHDRLSEDRRWLLSHEDTFHSNIARPVLDLPESSDHPTVGDATFIAHAREDIPRLLAEVFRLRALLGEG